MNYPDRPFSRRNYVLGVLNGAFYHFGSAGLANTTIVLPAFVHQLAQRGGVSEGWAGVMVGLVTSLTTVGWLWPQIIFSNIIETFERKKPFYDLSGVLRICVFAVLPIGTALFAETRPMLLFWTLAAVMFLYSSSGGVGLLSFMDIVSKSMPADMRGRFFGARAFWGSCLAFAGGLLVKRILNPVTGPGYPFNYVILYSLAWLALVLTVSFFIIAKEPPGPSRRMRITLLQQFRRGPRLLVRRRNFRRILGVRMLLGLCEIASPFYILYATRRMHVGEDAAGLFVICQVLFTGLAAFVSGRIGDRFGNKMLLRLAAVAYFLAPGTALCIKSLAGAEGSSGGGWGVVLFCGVFAMAGFGQTGAMIGALNYVLDIAPERQRPTYLGMVYTAAAPLTFVPLLGGAIVKWTSSYEILFALSAGSALLLLVAAARLAEPRSQAAQATASLLLRFYRLMRWAWGERRR